VTQTPLRRKGRYINQISLKRLWPNKGTDNDDDIEEAIFSPVALDSLRLWQPVAAYAQSTCLQPITNG
jgi:hypothetical protein